MLKTCTSEYDTTLGVRIDATKKSTALLAKDERCRNDLSATEEGRLDIGASRGSNRYQRRTAS